MKTARTLVCTLRLLSAAASTVVPLGLCGTAIVACDDENDPKTWVKRLDDPAQRPNAIKRLTQFYEDSMTKASNNTSAPEVKSLLDQIIDPLTKQYMAGGLDEKTRVDLMKFLAETHDPRTQPALAKALKDFEMGKTDDEGRVACASVLFMAKAGVKIDQTVVDELWNMFSKFKLSKAQSERLYHAVHDAVLAVNDTSYCDKAIEKLAAPVTSDVDSQKDQLMWWQLTSVQLISEQRCAKAAKPLIVTLLTPTKTSTLGATIQFALLKMAKDAEPELIKALTGQDPDYTKAAEGFEDKAGIGVIAEVLAQIGRPAGRDAILRALPTADTDTARTELAQALVQMPNDAPVEPAFLDTYKKLTWDSTDKLLGSLKPRAALAQQSAKFYDPKLLDWLLKELKKAPDYSARLLMLEAASKLMTPERKAEVVDAMAKVKKEAPADLFQLSQMMFDFSSAALDKCKTDLNCYIALLDEPLPSSSPTANTKTVKATWMAVIYGGGPNANATRAELLKHVDKVRNTGARIALCEAIDKLAPQGDVAAADALDKIIAADTKSGDKSLASTDNTVAQVAWRLRVRGQ
ncbi:MAG: hypothetical protein M3O46_20720 [Myxococcota bacterium]|nr:hypothetical protein [Myxococcota bacterium]